MVSYINPNKELRFIREKNVTGKLIYTLESGGAITYIKEDGKIVYTVQNDQIFRGMLDVCIGFIVGDLIKANPFAGDYVYQIDGDFIRNNKGEAVYYID